jgi:quercetin dioxygenase-like cupin family protein
MARIRRTSTAILALTVGLAVLAGPVLAQSPATPSIDTRCKPANQQTGEIGCHILAQRPLPQFSDTPVYWHLDTFPSRNVAEAAATPSSTVVESHGKVWLFTLGSRGWRPSGGDRVAEVGPLQVTPGRQYAAQFMEAVFPPGPVVPPHKHPGPEAWYMLGGEQCAETPVGVFRAKVGESLVLPGDTPMTLHIVGTVMRRSLVLILHDAAQPPGSPVTDWKPSGLCQR